MNFKVGDHVLIIFAPSLPHLVGRGCRIEGPLEMFQGTLNHKTSLTVNGGVNVYGEPRCFMKIDPPPDLFNGEKDKLLEKVG